MTIQRIGSLASQKSLAEHFTGTVRIDPLFPWSAPARAGGAFDARRAKHHPVTP